MAPPIPSYARSTAASRSREISKPQKPPVSIPPGIGVRKYNRRSTLSGHDRQHEPTLSTDQQDMLTIKPADPDKPCPFARLPTEIREMIYKHILPSVVIFGLFPDLPALLHVSRTIRCESAYAYYSQTPFTHSIGVGLNFSDIKSWIQSIPVQHRLFLARNRNLNIVWELRSRSCRVASLAYIDYDTWIFCRRFGNLYSFQGTLHRQHFFSFCQLADWLLWCGTSIHENIRWNYAFHYSARPRWSGIYSMWHNSRGDTGWYKSRRGFRSNNLTRGLMSNNPRWESRWDHLLAGQVISFLENQLAAFALPCVVRHATLDAKQRHVMKKKALDMLTDVDKGFADLCATFRFSEHMDGRDRMENWQKSVEILRKSLEGW